MRAFGKIEILLALALLIIGVMGIVFTVMVKRAPVVTEAAVMTPTMAIEELTRRLEKPVFKDRIKAGKEWIHDENNSAVPIKIQPEGTLYWRCRASHNLMDPRSSLKDAQPPRPLPEGKYQIAILVYRDYQAGVEQPAAAEFGMMMDTLPPQQRPEKREDPKPERAETAREPSDAVNGSK